MKGANEVLTKFHESLVPYIFSDEKVFTVAAPYNRHLYTPQETTKHDTAACLLCARPTFTKSVMVSVVVSKLGCSKLIFVESGFKADGVYYRNVLLSQQILPSIHQLAGNLFVFQPDSAPAHRARTNVEYLHQVTPEFFAPDLYHLTTPT